MRNKINLIIADKTGSEVTRLVVDARKGVRYYNDIFNDVKDEKPESYVYRLDFIGREGNFTFEGREYTYPIEISHNSFCFATTEIDDNGHFGTFATSLPISSKDYRENNPTKACLVHFVRGNKYIFKYLCDMGNVSELEFNLYEYKEILQDALDEAFNEGLLKDFESTIRVKGYTPINNIPYKTYATVSLHGTYEPIIQFITYKLVSKNNIPDNAKNVSKTFKDVCLIKEVTVLPLQMVTSLLNTFLTDDETLKKLSENLYLWKRN